MQVRAHKSEKVPEEGKQSPVPFLDQMSKFQDKQVLSQQDSVKPQATLSCHGG